MDRRMFLALSGMAGAASMGLPGEAAAQQTSQREYYGLRAYDIETQEQRDALVKFFADAAIPALNRISLKPVGVFVPEEALSPLYVVIPHPSAESAVTFTQQLAGDKDYMTAGASVLGSPAASPAFKRLQNSLLYAFEGMPKMETPAEGPDRVFQLRIYESPSVFAGKKKIEMFNTAEIAIFRKVGLNPVFFGETLFGTQMPNLTYMLGFDNAAEKDAAWKAFGADPEWLKLRAIPEYADKEIVSKVTNIVLKPAPGSQI